MLSVFFYNMRTVNLVTRESAALAVRECCIFWEKARIPIRAVQHCIDKLINLYNEWRSLQKNSKKSRQFLFNQRLPGRPGCLLGKGIKGTVKENRNVQRKLNESNRKDNYNKDRPSTSSLNFIQIDSTSEDKSPESNRCQLSIRDSVYVLQATLETLKLNIISFFDDSIPLEVKCQMAKAFKKKKAIKYPAKRLIIKPNQIDDKFIVNDTAERAVKLMEQYNATLTLDKDQKQFILKCVQEHRKIYPDCKKKFFIIITILTFFIQ
ncbi:hypothetical protein QTP88_017811 [Uroleucon formosanum]